MGLRWPSVLLSFALCLLGGLRLGRDGVGAWQGWISLSLAVGIAVTGLVRVPKEID